MNFRTTTRFLVSVSLLLFAAWLAYPGRNLHGNPSMEELVQSCTSGGTTFRLYVGNGGATTAFWYTITMDGGFPSREKQVLFSYDTPELSAITCGEQSFVVSSSGGNIPVTAEDLLAFRDTPRAYWRGTIETQSHWNPLSILRLVLAAALALAAAAVFAPIARTLNLRRS